jgi:hypothetical protein
VRKSQPGFQSSILTNPSACRAAADWFMLTVIVVNCVTLAMDDGRPGSENTKKGQALKLFNYGGTAHGSTPLQVAESYLPASLRSLHCPVYGRGHDENHCPGCGVWDWHVLQRR